MKKKLNSGLFAILLGIGMIVMSVYTFNKTDEFIDKANETTGVIVDMYIKKPMNSNSDKKSEEPEYCPIIEFVADNGDTIVFKSSSGSTNFNTYKTGKEVDILYDPNNPEKARIKISKTTNKNSSTIMIIVGIAVIGGGIFKFIYDKKRNKGIS